MAGGSNPPSATNPSPLDELATLVDAGARSLDLPDRLPMLLAVSGGTDSMALLHGTAHLVATSGRQWQLRVAHLDHQLRATSPEDAAFVADAAAALDLPCELRRTDVAALARAEGRSIEDAAREARYRFFAEATPPGGVVATAHTADDDAETVLLNLLRGAGLSGARGIPPRRGAVVRPLLGARRATLRGLLDGAGLAYREDPSNADRAHLRNRVRHEVVPLLEELRPGAVDRIGRFARLAADDDALLDEMAARDLADRRTPDGGVDWRHPPVPALARRVLRLAIGHPAPSAERVEALVEAAAGERGGVRIELGAGRAATVRERVMWFEP
ncbi:MAG: tRNA lysidine(34) synthetase TilS [Chloroflexi bacterium]|nr:tRNA lysidine(34) synthetase TilS [Chloroflexota bacterium]